MGVVRGNSISVAAMKADAKVARSTFGLRAFTFSTDSFRCACSPLISGSSLHGILACVMWVPA